MKCVMKYLAGLVLGATMLYGQSPCSWTLGLNGKMCGFRPGGQSSLWNQRADSMPTDPNSAAILSAIGPQHLFIDHELPYFVVDSRYQPMVTVTLTPGGNTIASDYCYGHACQAPFPLNVAWTQKGQNPKAQDFHGIVVDRAKGLSYEAEGLNFVNGQWTADIVVVWNLYAGDYQRPWLTPSANAAGTSFMPMLLGYDEAASDSINHALGFTLAPPQFPNSASMWFTPPALFPIQSNGTNSPVAVDLGTRFVLRANYPETGLPPVALAIVHALKKYGMILMDRGADMYVTATGDPRWPESQLQALWEIMPTDFRVITTSPRYNYHVYPKQ